MLTLLTCGAAYALPVGNPSEASLFLHGAWWDNCGASCDPCDPCFSWCDAWSFRLGYYGDFVFNRHLQLKGDDNDGADIDKTTISTNAGYLALNICDRVDVFGTLGATTIHLLSNAWNLAGTGPLTPPGTAVGFESDFSWSVGARGTLWDCDCFAVGLEGQYFQTNPNLDYVLDYATGTQLYPNDQSVTYSEWQVGLGASYRFATNCPSIALVPYVAVKWAGSQLTGLDGLAFTEGTDTLTLANLQNAKLWGWATGISLTLCDVIGVNVEGRWGDEKAIAVNGQFRF